jgi:hypothetical protein
MTVHGHRWFKAYAIVAHLQHHSLAFQTNVDFDASAIRMADDIVDTLLEDQQHLASHVRSDAEFVFSVWSPELELNVACHEHIASELAHPLCQKVKVVLGWIDSPDDFPHRIYEFPGDLGDASYFPT